MSIPNDVTRVTFVGHLGGGEVFDTGFWLAGQAPVSQDAANLMATTLAAAFVADLKVKLCGLLSTDCGYDKVRVYGYPNGGPTAATIGEAAISGGVGTGTNTQFDQVAMVATLLTGAPGRRNAGRMYLPLTGKIPSSTTAGPQIDSTSVGNAATGLATFFSNWNSAHAGAMGSPAVVSIAGSAHRPISAVRVDSRADIQRRRANRQSVQTTQSQTVTGGV